MSKIVLNLTRSINDAIKYNIFSESVPNDVKLKQHAELKADSRFSLLTIIT